MPSISETDMRHASAPMKRLLERLAQLVVVFVVFCVFNRIGYYFVVEESVSVFYPATAIDVLACLYFGWIGALGVFLGTLATPWNPSDSLGTLAIVGTLNAVEGLIPWAVFRFRRNLHVDLRDFRSFLALLFFGAIFNSAIFALAGNVLLIAGPGNPVSLRQLFTWWISDFSAVLLIAIPVLAFTGSARLPFSGEKPRPAQRTLVNAMEITAAIILLGWFATASIRNYLLESFENEVTAQQLAIATAAERATSLASLVTHDQGRTADADRRVLTAFDGLKGNLPAAERQSSAVQQLDRTLAQWLERRDGTSRAQFESALLDLRTRLDRLHRASFENFAARRTRIRTVALMMDFLLFTILGVALLDLIVGISRPLQSLHRGLTSLRSGARSDLEAVPSRFVELGALYEALDETSRTLASRERDLRIQTQRALEASRHKSDFLAKMSHELRTPLNSIVGFSELLLEPGRELPPDRRQTFVENISRSGRNLLRLINDLLDLAKVEAGKMSFTFEQDDLRRVVQNALAASAPLFSSKSQMLLVYICEEPVPANVDAGRLEQALLNLLSNATKFTPPGGEIRVTLRRTESGCEIEVKDSGIGIGKADQQRVFEEFEQAEEGGRHVEGTGLGLALARRFVEAHGGRITLHSEREKGSTFTIVLPLAPSS